MIDEILNFDYTLLLRLVAALICGAVIGIERGGNHHEAGLRTHIIVCLGAASVMVLSECIVKEYGASIDYTRMGAQVISGIGFLGAGSIIIDGNRIRGITTAAGIWTTACVGMVVGAGYYIVALALVLLMLFTIFALKPLSKRLKMRSRQSMLKLDIIDRSYLKEIIDKLVLMEVGVKSVEVTNSRHTDKIHVQIEMVLPPKTVMEELICELSTINGVNNISPVIKV